MSSVAALLGSAALTPLATAQSFSPSKIAITIGGNNYTNQITSLQFGPDNKLYHLQKNGTVVVSDITRQGKNNYTASNVQIINLVKNLQNHDDNGATNNQKERQATGILVLGTAANPVVYVSSCDWREGAGAGVDGDINLDTNSGIISRLTKNGATWEKVDIVRGLPRSEENHANNGLQIDPTGTKLLLAQGGNTNAGSPSVNFAMASEFALSAAVLSIDLPAIEAMPVQTDAYGQKYIYNLPTLNDPNPSRADSTEDVVVRWTSAGSIQRVPVPGVNSVISAAEGDGFTLALKSNNTVMAWGTNTSGQTTVPPTLTSVLAVAAGNSHSLALKIDGTVSAWGGNAQGQATVPASLSGVQRIAAGGSHSLALKSDGTVVAWGDNSQGQAPASVPYTDVQRIAAGGTHSLALKTDGSVVAWGNNAAGQCTLPPGTSSGVTAIAAGGEHSLALKTDGTVIAWGSNAAGQCTVPAGLTGVTAIAAGASHSAALKSDGTVVAWGDNGAAATHIPAGLTGVDFLSAGGSRTLALNTHQVDLADPFGGNDGLNQARLMVGEPVQIFAAGFRNPYDVLLATVGERAGKLYTFDNAPNGGWGGYPKNEGLPATGQPSTATNEYDDREEGTTANLDGLHLISQGYYGGHPNPIRANPTGAGWTWSVGAGRDAERVFDWSPTVDWPPVDPALADPREGDFRLAGLPNGTNPPTTSRALVVNNSSTTGIAEYTAPNFGGAMYGNFIATRFSGELGVQRIVMSPDGTEVEETSDLLVGTDEYINPLDVTCPSATAAPDLLGTIFVSHYSSDGLTVLEPSDFNGGTPMVCTGIYSYELDDDGDGYSNADEVDNGKNPCNTGNFPADYDRDFLSNLADLDDDNDGIPDVQDRFPVDRDNGTRAGGIPMINELYNGQGFGLFGIGFGGVMTNPGQDYNLFVNDRNGEFIGGGTTGVVTDTAVDAGNPRGATNTQTNGFYIGVPVDENTGLFRATSEFGGPAPFNGEPTGNQSQGVFIGNGDQDNYVMVAVHANGGAGGVEVVHEENGVVLSSVVYPAPTIFTGQVTLEFLIDPATRTVRPGYCINGGDPIYVGPVLTVGPTILNPSHGATAMAFGMIASTNGGPSFKAHWNNLAVERVASTASAVFSINTTTGGTMSNASTNTGDSFQLQNTSTGGQKIVSVTLDTSTAMLPDVVFDPANTAGDLDGKIFQLDGFTGTGTPTHSFSLPHNGVNSSEGYNAITVTSGPGVVFGPGALLKFSSDIDPTNIRGSVGPGPFDSSSVCGLELIGSTVTVTFDDGTVRKLRAGMIPTSPGFNNENRSSRAVLSDAEVPAPTLSLSGKSSPAVVSSATTVRVVGKPETSVQLWVFKAGLYLSEAAKPNLNVPNGGYDIDPFEANKVDSYKKYTVLLSKSGLANFTIPVGDFTSANGGINYVASMIIDGDGNRSGASNILTLQYNPAVTADALYRVDAGNSSSYRDSSGQVWAGDFGYNAGALLNSINPIAGTDDDALYQSQRVTSGPLDYLFKVATGNYMVKFHFAETDAAVTAAGQRVFDVLLEEQVVFNDLDIFAEAGANTALVKSVPMYVNDGRLKIGLREVTGHAVISAIEIFYLNDGPPIETMPPVAPESLSATNVKSGSLTLVWPAASDNVGVTGYRVFRNGSELGTTTDLTYPQTGLTPSTAYIFGVEAFDASGNTSARVLLEMSTPADTENPTAPVALKGYAANASANLSWSAASDDTAVTGYRVYRDSVLLGTVTTLSFSESGLTNGTNYLYEVVAIDATGKASTPAAVTVRPRNIVGVVYRLDTGTDDPVTGPIIDGEGNEWLADTPTLSFRNGTGIDEQNFSRAIAGTINDIIYQTRRYDTSSGAEMKYTFPVNNGDYEVRLHFAETTTSFQPPTTNVRKFDVKVQNQIAIDDLDIVATAGFATALVIPVPATVTNGNLTVEFIHIPNFNNPVICGIEIYALEAPPADTGLPTTPGSLAVTNTTTTSVALSWAAASDNVGVTGYRISRNGGTPVEVTGLSYTDTGLAPGVTYNYSVVAVDAAGNISADPATVSGSTLPDSTAPTAPGALTGASGNATATLAWTAATDFFGVTGYRIYKNDVLIQTVTALTYNVTGLTNETPYVFKVTAIDAALNESPAAQITVTPRALGPAAFRIDVGSSVNTVDAQGNTWTADNYYNVGIAEPLSNKAISGTDSDIIYQTRRYDTTAQASEMKYTLPITNGNYEVRLHFAETTSNFQSPPGQRIFDVKVQNQLAIENLDIIARVGYTAALVIPVTANVANGSLTIEFLHKGFNNPVVAGIEVFPILSGGAGESQPPSTPTDLLASNVTSNSATLTWTASTDNVGVTGYRILRNSVVIDTVTGLTFTNSGLTAGTLYHYSVVAIDAAGNSSPAATLDVTTTTPDTQAPSTPTNLAATPGLTQVALTWDASSDNIAVTGYRVIRNSVLVTTVTGTGYTDTGLSPGTAYAYQVIAVDASNNASAAATINPTTTADTGAPSVPESLVATPTYTTVGLTWTASTDNVAVTGYRVYRGATLLATVTTPSYGDTGLIPGTAYHYVVRAIDAAGNASGEATVDTTTVADSSAPSSPAGFDAKAENGAITLVWRASTDNVGVTGYEIRRNSALIATVTTPGYSDPGLVNGTLYLYEVRALDAAGNASAAVSDSATPREVGPALYRVDFGNITAPFVDSLGNTWATDTSYYVSGNNPNTTSSAIAGTVDDAIYQTYRWDSTPSGANLAYAFPMTAGNYEVRLHFAETFAGAAMVGGRIFDVRVDGAVVVDDLDIFARAGAINTALVVTFPVAITDGTLNLDFIHGVIQNPIVAGIEIFPILPPAAQSFEDWLTANNLTGQTTADSDGGSLSNRAEYELQMNPNNPNDDVAFRLTCTGQGATKTIALPALKPIGNYYVHRSSNLTDIGNVANRINTITKAQIEAMTPTQRTTYTVQDSSGGARAFYQLIFEPAP